MTATPRHTPADGGERAGGPRRVQRTRPKGGGMPAGAVYVGRPSRWGNPVNLSDVAEQYPSVPLVGIARMVLHDFRVLVARGSIRLPNWRRADGSRGPIEWAYPSAADIRAALAGRDLACWCDLCPEHAGGLPLGVSCPDCAPCHADVLLAVANDGGAA